MQESHPDRMAAPRRRGPPSKFELETPLPQPAKVVEIPQPPLSGLRCPNTHCARDMVPRRDATSGGKTYAHCSFCGARFVMTFRPDGRPDTVRLVREMPPA